MINTSKVHEGVLCTKPSSDLPKKANRKEFHQEMQEQSLYEMVENRQRLLMSAASWQCNNEQWQWTRRRTVYGNQDVQYMVTKTHSVW